MIQVLNDLLVLVSQNWETISSIIGFFLVTVGGYKYTQQSSKNYATGLAKTLMFAVEKKATDLLLTTGKNKFDFVVSEAYDKFPALVRVHISKPMFSMLVQQLFDEAVAIAKEHQTEQPIMQAPTIPVATTNVQQTIQDAQSNQSVQLTQSN
ncbi:hypothetical protein [Paenibacillus cremeus]|uniref:Uncharacterized protein n=1 Tax=Paenibacillus cremeus TaxID=2163881 RepID=A0A559KCY1_9BACL|nr:hypothetical protein [Paenibacillus cremeus]TVY09997.1 hypothetical protein FPZ49_11540 [Paenibacillus cremeus]